VRGKKEWVLHLMRNNHGDKPPRHPYIVVRCISLEKENGEKGHANPLHKMKGGKIIRGTRWGRRASRKKALDLQVLEGGLSDFTAGVGDNSWPVRGSRFGGKKPAVQWRESASKPTGGTDGGKEYLALDRRIARWKEANLG